MGNSTSVESRGWTLLKLDQFCSDTHKIIEYFEKNGTIPKEKRCPKCNSLMSLTSCRWRCTTTISSNKKGKRRCGEECSILDLSWFSNARLSVPQVMKLTYMMLWNYELQNCGRELQINKSTITNWISFLRDALNEWAMQKHEMIGGSGIIVEIDESKFGKRKYNRGHRVEGQWVFGGYERGSGKVFMVPVEKRDRETLLNIIKQFIRPGSIIMSDCWKAYDCLSDEGYQHLTVNHSINFVDKVSGAHTNGIESSWRHAKRFLPHYSRKKTHFAGYLAHFMFMKHCKLENKDPLDEFFSFVSKIAFCPEEITEVEIVELSEFEDSD